MCCEQVRVKIVFGLVHILSIDKWQIICNDKVNKSKHIFAYKGEEMYNTVEYKDTKGEHIFIDVRSPGEFAEATIPGAVNIPLFTDGERRDIGYTYVNVGVEKAKIMGVEAVSKKLPQIFSDIMSLKEKGKKLVLFCARGGMRSGSICSLLVSLGTDVYKLSGGYKGYRAFINEQLPESNKTVRYIVLHGKTGTGKTNIIRMLKEKGYDVLDLEGAANHRGSILGAVGLGKIKSQKAFETSIFDSLKSRKGNFVFVEGESKRIGNVIIPQFIADSMENGVHILVEGSASYRKKILIDEYVNNDQSREELLKALDGLKKYINNDRIESFKDAIQLEHYDEVVEYLMFKYYDPMYSNDIKKYNFGFTLNEESIDENTKVLEKWYESISAEGGLFYE